MSSFFDDSSQKNNIDPMVTALMNEQNLSHDPHFNKELDFNPFSENYQTDYTHSENQWTDSTFHTTPEHSLTQEIIDLISNTDNSLSDSDNQDTTNTMLPMFQHHVHYHPPHEYFHAPSSSEHLENEHEKMHTYHTVHSAPDYSVHHYHHLVEETKPINMSGSDDGGLSGGCVDSGGGQCDSGSGSSDSN